MNLNMNLSINNTIICQGLNELNFENIKKGQQILVFNPQIYTYGGEEINYNDFNIYFSKGSKIKNVYNFDKLSTNIKIDECYYEDCFEMDSNAQVDTLTYLKIKSGILELDYIESICEIDELKDLESDDYNYFKELYDRFVSYGFEKGRYTRIADLGTSQEENVQESTEYKCCFYNYFLIYLEDSFMGIRIKQEIVPSIYEWKKNIEYYLFDESFENYTTFGLNKNEELKMIDIIDKNYWDFYSENCLKHLKVYNATLKQIRTDFAYRQMLMDTLNGRLIYYISVNDIVNKFINPIYQDYELDINIYLRDFNFNFSPSIDADYKISDDPEIKKRQELILAKGKSVLFFLTKHDCPIDIYTGKILDKSYNKIYEDYEYIFLDSNRYYQKIFKRVDDELFIELKFSEEKDNAIKIIEERKNICNVLTE